MIYDDPISHFREKELKKWKRAWKIQSIEAKIRMEDLESICS